MKDQGLFTQATVTRKKNSPWIYSCERGQALEKATQRGGGISLPSDFQNSTCQDPGLPSFEQEVELT